MFSVLHSLLQTKVAVGYYHSSSFKNLDNILDSLMNITIAGANDNIGINNNKDSNEEHTKPTGHARFTLNLSAIE